MLVLASVYVGYAAGLSVSALWTATSLFFTAAGRRIGATATNGVRILMAIVLLGVTHRVLTGVWIPDANARQVLFLALSGIVGLSIGDQALFTAFVRIGPRLAMLIMTTAPLMAGAFGWFALGETISAISWVGIGTTLFGVAWVVLERPARESPHARHGHVQGVLLAFVGAACQAGGLLLSKQGIGHGWLPPEDHISPQAATLTRMFFAAFGMLPILWWYARRERRRKRLGLVPDRPRDWYGGLLLAAGGSVVGPYLGVWMSLEAADRVPLGVAQTLTSLSPVLILPFARWMHHEHISPRAVVGAIIAIAGITLLCLGRGG